MATRGNVNYNKLTGQSIRYKSQQGQYASLMVAKKAAKAIIPYEKNDLVMITLCGKKALIQRVNLPGPYYFLKGFADDQFFTHGQLVLVRKHK